MTCGRFQDMCVEALYGELDAQNARELEAHLAGCEPCRTLSDEMRATAAAMNERRRPDPGQEYWNSFYARLEARMDREGSVVDGARVTARRRSNVSWGYRVAAAVAVLAAGVWIGRSTMAPRGTESNRDLTVTRGDMPADSSSQAGSPFQDTSRVADTGRGAIDGPPSGTTTRSGAGRNLQLASADVRAREYIERSQVLLLALVNSSPDSSESGPPNFAVQRERAGVLVQEAAVLGEDLPGSDNRRLRELVASLQMILREIANLESQNDFDAVQIIRNRVDREGVLLQIDVEQMNDNDATGTGPKGNDAIDGDNPGRMQ